MPDRARFRRQAARPVADAPASALAARADDLAKDWLLELLAGASLRDAAAVPVAQLGREAPELCAALAAALASDEALARLEPGGELAPLAGRAGALAGAASSAGATEAVEALRRVLWRAALEELPRPAAALVGELAERLAAACSVVRVAALDAGVGGVGAHRGSEPLAPVAPLESAPEPPRAPTRPGAPIVRPPLVREDRADREAGPRPRVVAGDPRTHLAARATESSVDGRPFAVLLVELDGIDQLLAAELDGEVTAALERVERALEDLLRPGDALRREAPGRLWLTLPGAGPAGARALALRAASAVERAAAHRGTPLAASVGVASYPRDATDPGELAELAEDALLAARAAGAGGGAPPPL